MDGVRDAQADHKPPEIKLVPALTGSLSLPLFPVDEQCGELAATDLRRIKSVRRSKDCNFLFRR
jgi:hypothetical protein